MSNGSIMLTTSLGWFDGVYTELCRSAQHKCRIEKNSRKLGVRSRK